MAIGFPVKADYATGDVLSAANMNDLSGTLNTLQGVSGRNYAINGGTDIWQRGTSFTPTAGTITQLSDRWSGVRLTSAGWTVSQKTSATDSGVAGSTYFMRTQRNSGNTDLQNLNIAYNNLEGQSFIPLQGQSVTISFYAKAGANYSAASNILNVVAVTGTTADTTTWSISGTTNSTTRTLTTSWQRFSYTIAFGATDKAMRTQFYYTPVGTAGADDFFDIWGLQIEYGSVATAFTRAGGTLQGELAACQRYYYRFTPSAATNRFSVGMNDSTTVSEIYINFPVQMRTRPTALEQSGTAADYSVRTPSAGVINCSAVPAIGIASEWGGTANFTVASGLTAGNAALARAVNTSAYLGWSAEL